MPGDDEPRLYTNQKASLILDRSLLKAEVEITDFPIFQDNWIKWRIHLNFRPPFQRGKCSRIICYSSFKTLFIPAKKWRIKVTFSFWTLDGKGFCLQFAATLSKGTYEMKSLLHELLRNNYGSIVYTKYTDCVNIINNCFETWTNIVMCI